MKRIVPIALCFLCLVSACHKPEAKNVVPPDSAVETDQSEAVPYTSSVPLYSEPVYFQVIWGNAVVYGDGGPAYVYREPNRSSETLAELSSGEIIESPESADVWDMGLMSSSLWYKVSVVRDAETVEGFVTGTCLYNYHSDVDIDLDGEDEKIVFRTFYDTPEYAETLQGKFCNVGPIFDIGYFDGTELKMLEWGSREPLFLEYHETGYFSVYREGPETGFSPPVCFLCWYASDGFSIDSIQYSYGSGPRFTELPVCINENGNSPYEEEGPPEDELYYHFDQFLFPNKTEIMNTLVFESTDKQQGSKAVTEYSFYVWDGDTFVLDGTGKDYTPKEE